MWTLTIHYHGQQPHTHTLQPGITAIGRRLDNDIVLTDTSVSRNHAEIHFDPDADTVHICDLGSVNGTYVGLQPIVAHVKCPLRDNDLVQIGLHEIRLAYQDQPVLPVAPAAVSNRLVTSELARRPLDQRANLMYQTARQLNTVLDIQDALKKVSELMGSAMDADRCEVVLADQFVRLRDLGFSRTIANKVIQSRATLLVPNPEVVSAGELSDTAAGLLVHSVLCVPVTSGDEVTALIYLVKTDLGKRPFNQSDAQSVEAISHMVALTLERLDLFERVRQEQRLRRLLQRHMAPERVEYLVQNYLSTGRLPGLDEENATVLFADIADSTRLAEQLGARRFGEVLKRYYQDVSQLVFDHGGLLDKYLGDGVMATYGMTGDSGNAEARAVRTGLAILELVESRYEGRESPVRVGIGINSGPVVAGYVSTRERIEFTVLGDTVNMAFKLQALARPNRLFIGPATHQIVCDAFETCNIGRMAVKGRRQPIHVYEVLRKSIE